MKLYRFKDKLPELGTNVLVIHESIERNNPRIGICEFNLNARKAILSDGAGDYYPQDYYSDDPDEDNEYDLNISDYWCYPSSIKLPKKAQGAKEKE